MMSWFFSVMHLVAQDVQWRLTQFGSESIGVDLAFKGLADVVLLATEASSGGATVQLPLLSVKLAGDYYVLE